MPYGVDKKQGGDSPGNVKWMEKCTAKLSGTNKRTGKPYTKSEKIAICKSQLKKKGKASLEDVNIEFDVLAKYLSRRAVFMHNKRSEGKTYSQAEALFDAALAKNNFEFDGVEDM